jgi:cytolysin-activating lysine-acyltransferase
MDQRYKLMGPGVSDPPWSEAQALGAAAWLWMHSSMHRSLPLATINALLLPAIKRRQFLIASEGDQPVFYTAWALFDVQAERRYLERSAVHMPVEDWSSGDRLWFLDWIAPFGHSRVMARLLAGGMFARHWGRTLYHRGSQRGLRVLGFRGIAVLPDEARLWFEANPVQAVQPVHPQ